MFKDFFKKNNKNILFRLFVVASCLLLVFTILWITSRYVMNTKDGCWVNVGRGLDEEYEIPCEELDWYWR